MICIAEVLGNGRYFETRGQIAKALVALVDAGDRGVTALDVSSWAYRFAAYTFDLRKNHGLEIQTLREEHPGGWHGRHVLRTPVRIVSVETGEAAHV